MESTDYQRLVKVKNFLELKNFAEFSRKIGLKSSQIFTDIKNGKSHISRELATKICSYAPCISFEWLFSGIGNMAGNAQKNSLGDNNSHSGNITNYGANDRLLTMLEEAQKERNRLLDIIENLTSKTH